MRVTYEINVLCDFAGCDALITSGVLETPDVLEAFAQAMDERWAMIGHGREAKIYCPFHAKQAAEALSR